MKWREYKKLSLEEKREIRRETAAVMGEKLEKGELPKRPEDKKEEVTEEEEK